MESGIQPRAAPVASAERPRAVLLDFFDTLAVRRRLDDWIADAAAETAALDEATRAEVKARLPRVWTKARSMFPDTNWDLEPAVHRQVFTAVMTDGSAVPAGFAAALYEAMPRQLELNQGAAEFLHAVSDHGLKLAVVSNTALDIRPTLQSWGLLPLFDVITLSFEVGCVKPDPRIFRLTAEALHVDAAHCIMIGDSAAEDGGAIEVGMRCLISEAAEMWRAFAQLSEQLA